MVRIGVIGSRRRNSEEDLFLLADEIEKRIEKYGIENIILVSGGCSKGADFFAEVLHAEFEFPNPMIIHYPDQSKLDKHLLATNPSAAYAIINFARNTLVAKDSDELIAVVSDDRKGGTEDTIRKFEKMGKHEITLL